MVRIRRDVAELGTGWNDTLLWYARAVRELQALSPDVRTSWRYLGAIHGIDEGNWRALKILKAGDALPSAAEQDRVWTKCRHSDWWFLPWHRGYLWAFEEIVAAKVAELGGPNDWALPYWNYLDAGNLDARKVPDAFLDADLPDGSPNPLARVPRMLRTRIGPVPWYPHDVSLGAMRIPFFTSVRGAPGFGGSRTVLTEFDGEAGALESNPHNAVHVIVGGPSGYMYDPALAGLDPIFWLHHCNIDRLWSAWLASSGNVQENGADWMDGSKVHKFELPDRNGGLFHFTPAEALPGGRLEPVYDDLTAGTGMGAMPAAEGTGDDMNATLSSDPPPESALVGANAETVTIGAKPVATTIQLDEEEAQIAAGGPEQRAFLNLEHVKGTSPSGVLSISVQLKQDGAAPTPAAREVTTVALFGLRLASSAEGGHGGNGISVAVDVTELLKQLGHDAGAPLDEFEVRLEQPAGDWDPQEITVERVSLYRQPVE